jgi:FixJ family two-component response regulator
LADSLRFSLELEGFEVKLCDEHSVPWLLGLEAAPSCLVLDHGVFLRMTDGKAAPFAGGFIPVVLMVGHKNDRVLASARQAGVTEVIEKPLLGAALVDAIKCALAGRQPARPASRS